MNSVYFLEDTVAPGELHGVLALRLAAFFAIRFAFFVERIRAAWESTTCAGNVHEYAAFFISDLLPLGVVCRSDNNADIQYATDYLGLRSSAVYLN